LANKYIKLLLLLILVAGILFGLKYFSVGQNVGDFPVVDFSKSGEGTSEPIDYEVVEVVRGLFVPWSIVFTSDNRILVSERSGAIRVVENGKLLDKPLISFSVSSEAEDGLMGIELDPDYEENKLLYACYSYEKGGGLANRVVQIVDDGASASVQKVVIEDFPAAQVHAGCRIKFGPEGKLYITVGDAREKTLAQDLDSLAGKILRLNSDGSIPTDNPFYPSPIYSYGHRNPQGIDWDKNGVLYQTEHGPSTFDGPPGGDEVNKIEAGKNYGWPVVSHDKSKEGMADPLLVYTPAVAPASALVYSGKFIPQFAGDLFFGGLRGEGLYRVSLKGGSAENLGKVNGVDFGFNIINQTAYKSTHSNLIRSLSLYSTKDNTETPTIISTALERTSVSTTSNACSPLSGCDSNKLSVSTPIRLA